MHSTENSRLERKCLVEVHLASETRFQVRVCMEVEVVLLFDEWAGWKVLLRP